MPDPSDRPSGVQAVLPLLPALVQAWHDLTGENLAQLRDCYPSLANALEPLASAAAAIEYGGIPVADPPEIPTRGASLTAALDLADTVTPVPAQAHVALQILRKALAEALCMDVHELRQRSVGYAVDLQA